MELDKALELLQTSLPSCSVVRARAPTYIQVHTGEDADVLLVNVKNKANLSTTTQYTNGDDNKEVFELTGSPLKLDLSLRNMLEDTLPLDQTQHWSRDELSHLPTTLHNARTASNLYTTFTRNVDKEQCVPLWVATDGSDEKRTLLLTINSFKDHFDRGIVTYEGEISLDEISFEKLAGSEVELRVECVVRVAGMSRAACEARAAPGELRAAPHAGLTQLRCAWSERTLEVPLHSANITLEQEVIVGHELSPCRVLWKSICALDSINRALVDMTAAGCAAIDLSHVDIRPHSTSPGLSLRDNTKRLNELLGEVETYTYTAQSQKGGCVCITEDTTSLKQCLDAMQAGGSSNDFTYKLWDIIRDSENAEDVITLLLHALKALSSGKMKPFITPSNKTYLAKLILRLSRGHSQTAAVLKNLRGNPPQALSLLGQLGVEKTTWELTHVFTLVDNSFGVSNVLSSDRRSNDTIEHINQTLHDMTMGCGDMTLNPFENKSIIENSIRLHSETLFEEDANELSIDNFASLKKHGLVSNDKKATNEVPLIPDEIDISGWRAMLSKFAQLFVSLEHLNRMQQCLRLDMASLKCRASGLQAHYLSERSPVRTVSQLLSEPAQSFAAPVPSTLLREHFNNKLASFYRVQLYRRQSDHQEERPLEMASTTHVFSQQPVFPPTLWRPSEEETEVNEATLYPAALKYHHTKYTALSTRVLAVHHFESNKAI